MNNEQLNYDFEPIFNEVTKAWELRGSGQLLTVGNTEILAKNDKQTPFVVGSVKYAKKDGSITKPKSCIMFTGIMDNNSYEEGDIVPLTVVPNEGREPLLLLGVSTTERASMDDFDLSALEAAKNAVISEKTTVQS